MCKRYSLFVVDCFVSMMMFIVDCYVSIMFFIVDCYVSFMCFIVMECLVLLQSGFSIAGSGVIMLGRDAGIAAQLSAHHPGADDLFEKQCVTERYAQLHRKREPDSALRQTRD